MIPRSRPRRRRMLLMGDQSTAREASVAVQAESTDDDDGPSDDHDAALNRFRQDCGLTSAFEIEVLWPGQAGWQTARFDRPFVMVGRDPLCDVVLDHDDVSRRHACIQIVNGTPRICDLGSRHGVRKAGRLVETAELRGNDSVDVGPFSIRASILKDRPTLAADPGDDSRANRIALDFVNHRRRGGGWVLDKPVTIIGASKPSKVRLEHPSVSRVHSMLVRGRSNWWVVNLGSRIGTLLDGKYIEFAPISVGAELRIGDFQIRVATPTSSNSGADTSLMKGLPRSGSTLLSELTRSTLASRETRSRRANTAVSDEVVLELFREFAMLHERTLTLVQQSFREMLDIAVARHSPSAAGCDAPGETTGSTPKPLDSGPVPEPLDQDSPNLAVVNLSLRSEEPDDGEAVHARLAAKLHALEESYDGERKSLARRLLRTLSLGR
jgi:pSer/pThr/pTyr-binding forkhead associated (FHA) protein